MLEWKEAKGKEAAKIMGRVKNQHFVPQSYLERFAAESGRLFVFDKAKRTVFQTGPRNLASEQGFYDLPPDVSSDMQAVEKAFSQLEGDAKGAIDSLIAELDCGVRFDAFNQQRRPILVTFIALQDIRTRVFRQTYSHMHDEIIKIVMQFQETARNRGAKNQDSPPLQPAVLS